jgi:hypothetical protein
MPVDEREGEPGWDLSLGPLEREPKREPQTYQELSPQLDFLYHCEAEFSQWVQFADAKSGGVILVLSIGALDLFRHAGDFLRAYDLPHPVWGVISLIFFLLGMCGFALTVKGVASTLFPRIRPSKPSLFFFRVAASYPDGEAYAAAVTKNREAGIIENVAIQAWNLARIADDKYRHLRHAYAGALCLLIAWGVARMALSLAA